MAAPTGRRSPAEFTLALPPDWLVLDLAAGRIPAELDRLLDEAVRRDHAVLAHRGMIERQLRSVLRSVRAQDLSFCAVLATVVADILPMYATLTGTLRSGDSTVELAEITADLQRRPDVAVSRFQAGEHSAIRAQRRTAISDQVVGVPIEAAVWQYFIAGPAAGQVAILTGATPVLALAEQFGELFDAIVAGFAFSDGSNGVT
ncbi:MAG: hypothetical protein ABIP57_12160 [Jatrophihabitantaceae bacterium]